ncbi:hypothetical protein FPV16_21030 [Methylobacterium sp. W2]|uniref:HNH endonuclease n=1 Tax=Methylobacterium sp. W2 TaxID=2598107 RepID=UPI001D0CBF07|nr:HNH endonuclease [Methylobacterium sp. W2]MCC0808660.1 hypothetical protein [Methylobacterium sp. W2]
MAVKTSNSFAAPNPHDELNVYEAAELVTMSPTLIRWLSSYAPKQGISRKLPVRKDGDRIFVKRGDLVDFDNWLRLPWPAQPGKRPPLPTGIKAEIREEASGECAICLKNSNSCEAAHIDSVAKTKSNHPENLIWLCANHHTKFDHGGFGPSNDAKEFVASYKHCLTHFRRTLWQLQGDVTGRLFTILKVCDNLKAQLAVAKAPDQVEAVRILAEKTIQRVGQMAPTSREDPDYEAFQAMKPEFEVLAKRSTSAENVGATLNFISNIREEFARQAGYQDCPLCSGSGRHKHVDCPACGGDGEMTKAQLRSLDLDCFREVSCPLCEGARKFKGEDCPACDGNGEMELRFVEQVDVSEWGDESCPLCDDARYWKGETCPVCNGDGTLERRFRDRIDLRDYEDVDCPLCDGSGRLRGDDCPECHGDRQIERRFADQIDLSKYITVPCPLCEGSRRWDGEECRACGGEGEMDREQADRIDLGDYKMVTCPLCEGNGQWCQTCDGQGKVPRWVADRI